MNSHAAWTALRRFNGTRVEKRLIRFGVRSFTPLILLIVMASGSRLKPSVIARHNRTVSPARQAHPGFRLSSDKGYVKVPCDLYWDGILLQARINNSRPIWLALD